MNLPGITETIIKFIKDENKKRQKQGFVIGLSGGLDSSVVASLAVKAVGAKNVFGMIIPDYNITPMNDVFDSLELAKTFKIKSRIVDISDVKNQFLKYLSPNEFAAGNLTARLRMCVLYYYASIMDRLVLGTTDKSELELGYYTKYGDGASDIMPIGDLYKTQVRQLAKFLKIPSSIVNKESSPGLWKNQTAEKELGLSYEKIDTILKYLGGSTLDKKSKIFNTRELSFIQSLVKKNYHKKISPSICILSKKHLE